MKGLKKQPAGKEKGRIESDAALNSFKKSESVAQFFLYRASGFGHVVTGGTDILTDTANGVASGEREGNDGKK